MQLTRVHLIVIHSRGGDRHHHKDAHNNKANREEWHSLARVADDICVENLAADNINVNIWIAAEKQTQYEVL